MQPATLRLADLTSVVRPELDRLNRELLDELRPEHAELDPLVERALGYRGKQLRPALVFLAARAVAGGERGSNGHPRSNGRAARLAPSDDLQTDLVTVAKVVELIHTASLVHDDVLDGASMRRKLRTINALHGTEVPVLLGDYVYARSFSLAVSLDDPTCGRVLGDVVRRMCQGEIAQIFHRFDFDWDEERYLQVIHDKTATLYAAAARLGAHYGGGTPEQIEALDSYGRDFGIAFQIVDDCLDLVGDEEVVGKSLGTDLSRGKLTLPLLRLMQDREHGERLKALIGDDATGSDGTEARATLLTRLREEFPLREAVDASLATAHARVRQALGALEDLPRSEAKAQLVAIAEYVLSRKL